MNTYKNVFAVLFLMFFTSTVLSIEISVDGTTTTIDQALANTENEINVVLLPGNHTLRNNYTFTTSKRITIRSDIQNSNLVNFTTKGTATLSGCSSLYFQNVHFSRASFKFVGIPDISIQNAYISKVQEFITFSFDTCTATIVDSVFSQLSLAIYAGASSLTMRNTVMEVSYYGSIVKGRSGELHIDNCTFTYSSGVGSAAVISSDGDTNTTITRSSFLHNYLGVAVSLRNSGPILIEDSLFVNNSNGGSVLPGGALHIHNAQQATIQGSYFGSNSGYGISGSAIVANNVKNFLHILNCNFTNNQVGSAAYITACDNTVVEGSVFGGNTNILLNDDTTGGGLYISSSNGVMINNSVFSGNSANNGGAIGISLGTDLTIQSSHFYNNTASSLNTFYATKGGALMISSCSPVSTSDSVFTSNYGVNGGACHLSGILQMEIIDIDYTNNSANLGGAVFATSSSGTMEDLSFVKNTAYTYGGAAYVNLCAITIRGYFEDNIASEFGDDNYCGQDPPFATVEVMKSWMKDDRPTCSPCRCTLAAGPDPTLRAVLTSGSVKQFRNVTGMLTQISADRVYLSDVNDTEISNVIVFFDIREAGPSQKGELSASAARQAILSLSVSQYTQFGLSVKSIEDLLSSPEETITDSPINNDSGSNNGSRSANKGAIIGGVIGGIAFIAIIAVIVLILIRRKKTKHNNNENESELHVVNASSSSLIPKDTMITNVTLENVIGRGNFGEVYQGTWNNATKVALKKLKEGYEQQFAQESSLLMKLNHPNVVRILGVYKHSDNALYMALEFCKLGSLDSFLQYSTDLTVQQRLRMARDIAAGMQYLESKKVIHRDLSARNILVVEQDGNFSVKISDLGLSRESEDYYRSDNKQIPYKWCAPEVIKYSKSTSKSDVWSYAVCLWEIFSNGEVPYQGMTNTEVINQVAEGYRLSKPSLCTDVVYELMMECWNKDPNARPTFAEIHQKIDSTLERVANLPTSVVLKQASDFYI